MASNGKRTKGNNKAFDRRLQRRREKNSDVKQEIMLGATCRRHYGDGKVR